MKKWLTVGLPCLVATSGVGIYWILTTHAVDASQTPYSYKENLIQLQIQHNKETGGKGYIPSIASASLASSMVSAKPQLVTTTNIPPVSAAMWNQFNLSPRAFTDNVNWTVEAGNEASSPSTGVLIVINLKSNLSTSVITAPNAGLVQITGFNATTVDLKSNLGVGEFDLASGAVTWN